MTLCLAGEGAFAELKIATMARIGSCLLVCVCDDFELHPNDGIVI